ncbi:MAG: dTDP-4-dehydrorhamnose 3,5-epimerase [Bacteroidales bacterium]
MNFIPQILQDVWVIEPKVFGDSRGYFTETYKQALFEQYIGKINFIQDNESKSGFGVLRGLHYQKNDAAQAKLVRVIQGKVLDIIVDLRTSSQTYGKWLAVELSDENHHQLFVPRGFAHGFLVLSETAIFNYKVDNAYQPEKEACLIYNDPTLNISYPIDSCRMKLSDKDLKGLSFADAPKF